MSKEFRKGKYALGKEPPPCLTMQWVDNKVVSVVTTLDNANAKVSTVRNLK